MGIDMRTIQWISLLLLAGLVSMPVRAELRVFACEPEWASLVGQLMPEADITTATHHLQDPHYIEARPSLIAAMGRADIAVCTGASLEAGWLPTLLQRASNPDIQTGQPGLFFAADHAQLQAPHDHVDRSMGDVHPEGNPHVHLSPNQMPVIADALANRLIALAPAAENRIKTRHLQWQVNWRTHQAGWQRAADQLQGISVVVQHTGFTYLLNWLGVQHELDLEPKPGLPPSASHLGSLLVNPRLKEASGILVASYQDRQPADWLAEKTGLPVVVVPGTVTGELPAETLSELISEIVLKIESIAPGASDGGV